jgi:low affinity Fe/Cu permease
MPASVQELSRSNERWFDHSVSLRALRPRSRLGQLLERGSRHVTAWTGSSWAFAAALLVILIWLVTGPLFHFSDTWQLVINTGTTIITFLMVFLIQHGQNRETRAIQIKLNELIRAQTEASDGIIDVEQMDDAKLRVLCEHYHDLARQFEARRRG